MMMTIPAWQHLYREALLELRPEFLRGRIDAAKKAIERRMEEINDANHSAEERQVLADALRGLRVLAESECRFVDPAQLVVRRNEVAS